MPRLPICVHRESVQSILPHNIGFVFVGHVVAFGLGAPERRTRGVMFALIVGTVENLQAVR